MSKWNRPCAVGASIVPDLPPTVACRSWTVTSAPAWESSIAAARPPGPAPMIETDLFMWRKALHASPARTSRAPRFTPGFPVTCLATSSRRSRGRPCRSSGPSTATASPASPPARSRWRSPTRWPTPRPPWRSGGGWRQTASCWRYSRNSACPATRSKTSGCRTRCWTRSRGRWPGSWNRAATCCRSWWWAHPCATEARCSTAPWCCTAAASWAWCRNPTCRTTASSTRRGSSRPAWAASARRSR